MKLLDYQDKVEELQASNNPFAMVVLAHLWALQNNTLTARFTIKRKLARLLFEKRFSKNYVLNLLRFNDWLFQLPKNYERQYNLDIKHYDEELHTMYLANFEREYLERGEKKGRKEGKKEGEGLLLMHQLKAKFGKLPPQIAHEIKKANEATLLKWASRILSASTLEQVFKN